MKKTVIAIWGTGKQGKSETIKSINENLEVEFPNLKRQIINDSADITVILTIKKIKIGIESQGDPGSRIFKSLKLFTKSKCQIIICASRTSGSTVNAISELNGKYGYEIIWTANYTSKEKQHRPLNKLFSNNIIHLIKLIIEDRL